MDGRIFSLTNTLSQRLSAPWTVEEMAAGLNLSPSHFQKLFKEHTGVSPIQYLNTARLERARQLLESTFLQIKEIGVMTGLTNNSHFTRDFKRKFGLSPREYRKKYWEAKQIDLTPQQ